MGIIMIGSTLRLEGGLTEQDCPFLQMVMKEAIYSSKEGFTVEMSDLHSAEPEVLQILSAGCFLLRLVGSGADFAHLPTWLPKAFKSTVPTWSRSRAVSNDSSHNRKVVV